MRPLAVGALAVLALLGPGSLGGAPLDPVAAHPAAPTSATVEATVKAAAALAGHPIDNDDKSEVRDAYRSRFKDNTGTPSGWIGSVQLCLAGTISQEAQDATLESVNFVRALAGLDAVGFGDGLSAKVQEAALMMDANNALSHDPPEGWDCWTEDGAEAAGHANLALTTGTMDAGEAIELYMDDPGAGNRAVGHRRWILRPEAKTFGNGMTDTASALWVLGPTDERRTNPKWVSWPSRGWFPAGLQPRGRWSLSSGNDGASFADATVTVREKNGLRLDVHAYKPHDGYAKPTLVFHVAGLERDGKYHVTVRGIKGAAASRHTWTVKLFG